MVMGDIIWPFVSVAWSLSWLSAFLLPIPTPSSAINSVNAAFDLRIGLGMPLKSYLDAMVRRYVDKPLMCKY